MSTGIPFGTMPVNKKVLWGGWGILCYQVVYSLFPHSFYPMPRICSDLSSLHYKPHVQKCLTNTFPAEEPRFIMAVAEERFVACDSERSFNFLVFHLGFPWTWFSNLPFEPTNSSESEITGTTVALLARGHWCWRAATLFPWDIILPKK